MDDFSSGDLIRRMEKVLKRAIKNVLENMDPDHQDFKRELVKSVNKKMRVLTSQFSFHYTPFSTITINNFSYTPGSCNKEGVMIGELVATYTQKPDHTKYGGPGYPGKENGQLCEHPKGSKKFYKWNAFLCRWEDVYKDIPRASQEPDWYDKLTNNAAFEAWWGNNTSGGNYLRSDRKRNGADNLWGDPGVGSRMGTFKQISGNVMQSIYRFTLNLKSAIGHYEKLSNAFKFKDEEENPNSSNNDDIYTAEEEPKVTITIEKVNHWSYFMNNGHIDQSGSLTRKDSIIYVKDSSSVRERILAKNNAVKKDAYERFQKNN